MDFEPTWEDLKRYDDENRALRAEVERLRAENERLTKDMAEQLDDSERIIAALKKERDEARANLDRVAKTLAIVLGVSFESARDLPEKCSIGQMMPLQRAEKAEAEVARLKAARLEHSSLCEGSVGLPCDLPSVCDPLRAEVERLTVLIKNGMRAANALTLETQTPEDMATDLVRQVREARQQRDEARTQAEKARALLKEMKP